MIKAVIDIELSAIAGKDKYVVIDENNNVLDNKNGVGYNSMKTAINGYTHKKKYASIPMIKNTEEDAIIMSYKHESSTRQTRRNMHSIVKNAKCSGQR